jgi:2-polyprenyl-6-methoxyphenol hydroxylase-like FAD-dependent oxidoreductase
VDVLIVGGGIAGLVAAIALRRKGLDVHVYEREPVLAPVGAGLCLWHNAMLALKHAGIKDQLQPVSTPFFRQDNRTWDGKLLESHDFGDLSQRLGVAALTLHRGDLHEVLLANLPAERLHLGRRCIGLELDVGHTRVLFDGDEVEAGCVVGADGLWSVVRSELFGPEKPRYAGYTCYRGLVDYDPAWFPEGHFVQSLGDGARFGIVHTGKHKVYWWATVNAPEGTSQPVEQRKAQLLRIYGSWASPVPEAIEATPVEAILLNDILDRPPSEAWGRDGVTLAGDAAHPMTPNMAQGACQAIEDGIVLAKHMAQTSLPVPDRLRAYEAARQERTAAVTQQSWLIGARGQGLLTPEEAAAAVPLAGRERLLMFEP